MARKSVESIHFVSSSIDLMNISYRIRRFTGDSNSWPARVGFLFHSRRENEKRKREFCLDVISESRPPPCLYIDTSLWPGTGSSAGQRRRRTQRSNSRPALSRGRHLRPRPKQSPAPDDGPSPEKRQHQLRLFPVCYLVCSISLERARFLGSIAVAHDTFTTLAQCLMYGSRPLLHSSRIGTDLAMLQVTIASLRNDD